MAEHSFVLVRFDLTLKKLLQWLVSTNHVTVILPPQGLVMVNKNDKVVYDEVMERQRKVSESDSNQQSYGQLVESQLQARYV